MAITADDVMRGYAAEARLRRPPVTITDVPFAYEDISPAWATTVLCGAHPGAAVTAVTLGPPDDGTSNRRRLHLRYNAAGVRAGLPETLFCKATQALSSRLLIGPIGAIEAEVGFYTDLRGRLPEVEAPVCRHAACNAALNSIVMLDELAPGTVFCTHTTPFPRERAEAQIALLATLHGAFLRDPALAARTQAYATWPEAFARLAPFFEAPCDQGFALAEAVIPPRLFARRAEIWPATRASVDRHHALPHSLMHGDVHVRNWYILPDGRIGLADWQGIARGHWSRDVAYALVTSLTVEDRRAWLADLLPAYHARLEAAAGRSLPYAGFFDEVRRQLLSVLAFWTMTMVVQPGMTELVQPRDATLELVRRIAVAIDDLDALDACA